MGVQQGTQEAAYTCPSLPADTGMLRKSTRSDSALFFQWRTWRFRATAASELRMIDDLDELRHGQARPVNSGSAHRERSQIHAHCSTQGCSPQPDLFVSDKYLPLVDSDGAPQLGGRRFCQIRLCRAP